MDTELLKTFLEVSRTRHFGRAAEALYLTQSAVSFRIRQLENQLGVSLFTRHRNNIRLTSAGERLLPYAETLMGTWLAAKKDVARASGNNEFAIGASAALWECMLSSWLIDLYKVHPSIQFEARVAQRQSLVKQLHERQLDLLLTTEPPKMDEFVSQQLGTFSLGQYCSSSFKQQPTAGTLHYLRLEWGPDFQHHNTGHNEADNPPALITTSAHIAKQMLKSLGGYTWLPVLWAEKMHDLSLVADSVVLKRPLYAIWLQNSDKQSCIQSLLKTPVFRECTAS